MNHVDALTVISDPSVDASALVSHATGVKSEETEKIANTNRRMTCSVKRKSDPKYGSALTSSGTFERNTSAEYCNNERRVPLENVEQIANTQAVRLMRKAVEREAARVAARIAERRVRVESHEEENTIPRNTEDSKLIENSPEQQVHLDLLRYREQDEPPLPKRKKSLKGTESDKNSKTVSRLKLLKTGFKSEQSKAKVKKGHSKRSMVKAPTNRNASARTRRSSEEVVNDNTESTSTMIQSSSGLGQLEHKMKRIERRSWRILPRRKPRLILARDSFSTPMAKKAKRIKNNQEVHDHDTAAIDGGCIPGRGRSTLPCGDQMQEERLVQDLDRWNVRHNL